MTIPNLDPVLSTISEILILCREHPDLSPFVCSRLQSVLREIGCPSSAENDSKQCVTTAINDSGANSILRKRGSGTRLPSLIAKSLKFAQKRMIWTTIQKLRSETTFLCGSVTIGPKSNNSFLFFLRRECGVQHRQVIERPIF
jgi:hypothetical protein